MISRFVKIQLAVFLALALVALTITGINYVGLDQFVSRPFQVKVYLVSSGNVFKNAEVTYRGVPVGKVEKVEVASNGSAVTIDIERQNNKIPKNSRAEVQKLSAVGEQYI